MYVKALQGDTLDQLCWRHYGATQGVTEMVLSANPGLSKQIYLNAGQEVELPELPPPPQRATVQIWD